MRQKPHQQSDHMIGYPVPENHDWIAIALMAIGAVCAFYAWVEVP